MTKARPTPGRRSAGPKTTYQHRVAHAPAQSRYIPHIGAKQIRKAAPQASAPQVEGTAIPYPQPVPEGGVGAGTHVTYKKGQIVIRDGVEWICVNTRVLR